MTNQLVEIDWAETDYRPAKDLGEPLGPGAKVFEHLRGFEGNVKGSASLGVVKVFERDQPGRLPELLDQLAPVYRAIVEDGIVPSSWYPAVFTCALLRARDRLLPGLTTEEQVRLGQDYFGILSRKYYGIFFRLAGPERLSWMASKIWGQFQSVGKLVIDEHGKGFVRGRLTESPANLEPGHTESLAGAIAEALITTGARNLRVRFGRQPPDTMLAEYHWG